ncbi:tagatose-bisphosphate aldolase subunit GatY [Vibrio sp. Hep-1b-8]|uniref:tagatose-bisphosphate aldolase subunit GatY n=1 Tax=Vibrio sp. Hep-1b-8 TaxID=2144187 RepID=UPI001110928A|nr:tagatose-bisphosphate aldolase subunit GatY [Vibrio sp. Hep-1b-8]TMX44554.1 tagatose-bisphosphate aldolase [Vibrio sp. Hep-1b-8]
MYLVSNKKMLTLAQEERYAVPAFNIHNLETLQVVAETAAELSSPIIIAGTEGTYTYAGTQFLVDICKRAAIEYNIPIALHLDHHMSADDVKSKILMGVRSVMIDGSHYDLDENIRLTRNVVEFARKYDVSVEAELGRLGGREDNVVVSDENSYLTDPITAAKFVEATGVDSLAVAIGSAHGMYEGEPTLDLARLSAIRDKTDCPLVLHGGSGLPDLVVRSAIELGITKVNVATELKIAFSNAVKEHFSNNPKANDPRYYLEPGKVAMKTLVKEKIRMCGSEGKLR